MTEMHESRAVPAARPSTEPKTISILRVRPCRTKGCSGTRPVVPIGCADAFDRCAKCYRKRLGRVA